MKSDSKFFFLILIFFSFLILFIPVPIVHAAGEDAYIISGDVIKNFKFDSIGGEEIDIDTGSAFNNKLVFETQPVWTLHKDDVHLTYSAEVGGVTYLYYKTIMKNKINIYTNVFLDEMCEIFQPVTEEFQAGRYRHSGLAGDHMFSWNSYIYWDHWNFGNIRTHNFQNNVFMGTVVMSFDINPSPLPDIWGDFAIKQFDYIAVSSAGVVSNTHGLMTDQMPEIVGLTPAEYESEERNEYMGGGIEGDMKGGFDAEWNPMTELTIYSDPLQTFDAGIRVQSEGSSMNPTNKDGTPLWSPKEKEESQTGCKIRYNVNSLSPVVYEYGGKLTWYYQYIETRDKCTIPIICHPIKVYVRQSTDELKTEYRSVALHGINRYVQVEMQVVFNVWTSVKIEALSEEYEYLKLHYPEEYYDELVWTSIVGGFGGGQQYTADPGAWLFDTWLIWIIVIVVVIIVIFVFIKIGLPIIQGKQRIKELKTVVGMPK